MSLRGRISLFALLVTACAPTGVGDPCIPESIANGGFHAREVTIEAGSAQCRTRVCMVFHLEGDPRHLVGTESCPADATDCVLDDPSGATARLANSLDRVFCTCRCDGEGGNSTLPLCACTDGFACVPDTRSGASFCVPEAVARAEDP